MRKSLLFLLLGFLTATGFAQLTTLDYSVQLEVEALPSNGDLRLSWPLDTTTTNYYINRKTRGATSWGVSIAVLGPNDTSFTDTLPALGDDWEYKVQKTTPSHTAYGYAYAGNQVEPTHYRGSMLIVFDTTYKSLLGAELARLEEDLRGDGWLPEWIEVDRGDSVPDIKARIIAAHNVVPGGAKAIFILGHVPVPYSGNIYPDGHTNHEGAWPADLYYGEFNGGWSDFSINNTVASRTANHNIPFDGKFDQSSISSDVEVPVGRVDFANLSSFSESEADLMKRYLDKDHNWRHKVVSVPNAAVVDDNFGVFTYPAPYMNEYFGASGWRNFSPLVGRDNVNSGVFRTDLLNNDYLWAYGCGGGSYSSASGIINTTQLATDSLRAVFTMLFGSYFGDWDANNALMRASLASKGQILTCAWAGRPQWHFHPMGLGEPIAGSVLMTQNNSNTYDRGYFNRYVHVALMGDPTLRQHNLAPASGLAVTAVNGGKDLQLSWSASADAVAGYYVYRADSADGYYAPVSGVVTGTTFTDSCLFADDYYYMVRAVELRETSSGSYFNLSQGIFGAGTTTVNFVLTTDSVSTLNVCIGEPFEVYYTAPDAFCAGNTFSVELSDVSGNFGSPLVIGTSGTTASGSVTVVIPAGTPQGSGYRVRITGDSPGIVANDNGLDLQLDSVPVAAFAFSQNNTTYTFTDQSMGNGLSWFWDLGDGNTDSTANPVHTYANDGAYVVSLMVSNGCGTDTFSQSLNVVDIKDELGLRDLSVWPNPANGEFHVSFTAETGRNYQIRMSDPAGRVLATREIQAVQPEVRIDWRSSGVARGIYWLEIREEGRLVGMHKIMLLE